MKFIAFALLFQLTTRIHLYTIRTMKIPQGLVRNSNRFIYSYKGDNVCFRPIVIIMTMSNLKPIIIIIISLLHVNQAGL